jgi:catechol 2,3-dioxygenase-like lactoylglutathione lyase family enzyme
LTYELQAVRLPRRMRATRLNHVSISASDLEVSTRFYEQVLGMERIPTPTFGTPVQWLRVGDMQLHLFQDSEDAPTRHHLGLTVDDFEAAYDAVRQYTDDEWGWRMVELPSGQVQLYFRDPAGNLIELNWPDVNTLDRSRYPELQRLADHVPQRDDSQRAVLYLAAAG